MMADQGELANPTDRRAPSNSPTSLFDWSRTSSTDAICGDDDYQNTVLEDDQDLVFDADQDLVFDADQDLVPDAFKADPYALEVYENALKHGKEKHNSIRVNIVGNFNQGKTSLLRRLLGQSTDGVESTNGINIEIIECKTSQTGKFVYEANSVDDPDYYKRILNVVKSEQKNIQPEEQYQNWILITSSPPISSENVGNGRLLGENNIKRPASFSVMRRPTNFLRRPTNLHLYEKKPKMKPVVSSPYQRRQALLTPEQLSKLVSETEQTASEVSASDNLTRFSFWDFGGQFMFYATHSLFHSKRAIYLLVFDLSTQLSSVIIDTECPIQDDPRTMQYYFEFWMNSIHSFVGSEDGREPKVLLVGTHKDKVPGDENTKNGNIDRYFDGIRALFDGKILSKHLCPEEFAVDNTVAKDDSVELLRQKIIDIGKNDSTMIEIPAKWILLETSLDKQKQMKVITFDQLRNLDSTNEFPILDVEELKLFLRYHHSKGTFIYFDEPQLSDYIFVDPQFVVDAFKSIVTCERFTRNDQSVRPLWLKLLSEAKLENRLIEFQWSKDQNFIKHKDILLMVLKKHNILSEVTKYNEETNESFSLGWYIVPSFLKYSAPQENKEDFFRGKQRTMIRYVIKFKNSSIVPLVYHRCLSASVGQWSVVEYDTKPLIFQNCCVVRIDRNHAGVLEMNLECIELWLVSLRSSTVDNERADCFRRFTESVVNHEFKKLQQDDVQNIKPYLVCYKCNHESHGVNGSKNIEEIDHLSRNEHIPCPDLQSHNSFVGTAAKYQWFTEFKMTEKGASIFLTDKVLSKVSQHIGKNWDLLGLQLGLSSIEIDHIIEDSPNSALMKRYRMLKKWVDKLEDDKSIGRLVSEIKRCSSVDIDWNEIRNFVEKMEIEECGCNQY